VAGAEELLPPAFLARVASLLAATKRRLALSLAADGVERLVGAADEVERVADDLRLRRLLAHGLPVGVVGIDRDRRDRLTLGNGERAQIALDDAPAACGVRKLSRPGSCTPTRPSRAGQVADASAWLGEGLEPIRFDASPELRQRSPHETEMERTDDGLVGRRHLLEGTALQHDLVPALHSPELGPETELLVEMNDLVDRLLLRDRRKRCRSADEVRSPHPSSLLGTSAGVAL
jgi:hypothetical protein